MVYSTDDTSPSFYKSETPIEVESTYNGLTATAVYTGFETESYSIVSVLCHSYSENITSVVVEDYIYPISTEN